MLLTAPSLPLLVIIFENYFTFGSRQKDHFQVDLEWLYPEAVADILDYMYTGQIQLGDNAELILTAAAYFLIEGLQEVVTDFLQEHLNVYNCFSILSLADEHSLQALKSSCTRFISANFVQASGTLPFLGLQKNLLEEVISNDHIEVSNEKDVFNAVVRWDQATTYTTELFILKIFSLSFV